MQIIIEGNKTWWYYKIASIRRMHVNTLEDHYSEV